ncbi:hypothetical protein HYT57_04735 [Candidatus Woesearchaeota archaeon]|nr:hypothetical protein [Candidatus Woesearchaeota archaeon]
MDEKIIEEARVLIKNGKFRYTIDAAKDISIHNFSLSLIIESFEKGLFFTKEELYKEDKKDRSSDYYCIHKYKALFGARYILIAFTIEEGLVIIHTSPAGKEAVRYREKIKELGL